MTTRAKSADVSQAKEKELSIKNHRSLILLTQEVDVNYELQYLKEGIRAHFLTDYISVDRLKSINQLHIEYEIKPYSDKKVELVFFMNY